MPRVLGTRFSFPKLSTAPSSPAEADAYYDTDDDKVWVHNGTTWVFIGRDRTFLTPHSWTIGGEIKVPSSDTDYIPPFFIPVASGQTVTLTEARHRINGGTSATVKLQKNGGDITGWTGISVTTTSTTTNAADEAFTDEDTLALVVTAVSGTPINMTFTVFLQHVV
jgi:hypothetical protein